MDPVAAVTSNSLVSAEAIEAAQANATAGGAIAQTQAQKLGMPPVGLAAAAVANTINAQLVSSQWGIDPGAVSGVYAGAAASGGLFSGDTLLALLQTLPAANADQALPLLGIETPSPSSIGAAMAAKPTANANAASADAAAAAQSAGGADVSTTVDPLWGVRA
jgi:hypothetical protein